MSGEPTRLYGTAEERAANRTPIRLWVVCWHTGESDLNVRVFDQGMDATREYIEQKEIAFNEWVGLGGIWEDWTRPEESNS